MKKIVVIIFCVFASFLLFAQNPDAALGDNYFNIGLEYYNKGDYDNALLYYENALEVYKAQYGEKHPNIAGLYNNIGIVFVAKGDYENAQVYCEKGLKVCISVYGNKHTLVADSYFNIGKILFAKEEYDKALNSYEQALEIWIAEYGECHPDIEKSYYNIAKVLYNKGEYDRAIIFYEKSLEEEKNIYGEVHPYVVDSCIIIGNLFANKGDYVKALIYHKKALEIRKIIYGEADPCVADSYNAIGDLLMKQGDYEKSLLYHKNALRIRKDAYGENHSDVAATYNNIGSVLTYKSDYENALEYYAKALEVSKIVYGETHYSIADIYSNIGNVLDYMGLSIQAIECYEKSLEIYKVIYGENDIRVAYLYTNLGFLLQRQGDFVHDSKYYELALGYYENALTIQKVLKDEDQFFLETLYYNMGKASLAQNDYNKAYVYFNNCMDISINSSVYLKTIAYTKDILAINNCDVKLIEKVIRIGIDTAERARLDMSSMKTDVMKKSMPLYYYGVQFESSRNSAPKAFEYSEALRNRGFLEQLGTGTALNLSDVTPDEKNEIQNLMDQITASRNVITKLANAETDVEKERYKKAGETLTEAEKKLAELDEKIGKRIPVYAQLRNPQPVKAEDAQKWCGKKRAILEYILPSEDSESGLKTGAYCLVITADGIKSVPLDSEYDYYTAVAELRSAITEKHQNIVAGNIASIHKYRTTLYEKLIEPVMQYIPSDTEKLLIVPDGSLSSLPFDILGKPDEKLLGEQYALSFSPSVSVSMFKEKHTDKTINMLGIGNPVYSETESSGENRGAVKQQSADENDYDSVSEYYKKNIPSWENLPGSWQELKNLKTVIFPKDKVDIFEQANATEKLIKQLSQSGKLAEYNQILIACHGYFNTEKPEMSTLVFSEVSGAVKDSPEDGYLTVDELALLKMNAQFLNLSACQTGLSAEKQGDGMLGLTRSCIIAGADNVGVTLWSVNDKATCAFQEYLYGFIKEGMAYPAAYQKAKEKMKVSEEWSNPEYWAGFVLYE